MKLFKTVKFRLTIWYAFMLTVFLSIFAFLMYSELSRALYQDAEKNMVEKVSNIEESLKLRIMNKEVDSGVGSISQNILTQTIKDWEKNEQELAKSILMIRILGLKQSVIISNLKGWGNEIIFPDFERDSIFMEQGHSFQTIHFRGLPIRLYYHLVELNKKPLFIIQSAVLLHEVENTLRRLKFIIGVSIPVAVAFACFAGWLLAKRFLAPVDHMIQKAHKITDTYLTSRLPRTYTQDELDRLAETLNEMIDRIESSTKAVREFSSDVSHELKTPLAIIRGEIDLASRRARSQDELQQTIAVIGEEVNEMIRLVNDLMILVRSDAKQLNIEKQPISVKYLLDQIMQRYQKLADSKGIELSMEIEENGTVLGDESYLKRLFSNLLDNAIKFTFSSGKVKLNVSGKKEWVVIKIQDTGIGMEPETQNKIFSRFYRADRARSREGSGLGLSIVKAICEAHNGILRVTSSPEKGTSVFVVLPLA